ncbi:TetR/AcrR family transcriptional regulator [Nocardia macrotermitis]|uniref:HTH-type transcriptional repressor ComR n=1 Tax=Nocardia macrotermitis TaxID=2585198 RepID=A0A7K0DC91_9NOCA|nr:TetR/AcrR family transcriptional regulator [Nocardia macrotermitis]MQY23393.1 HTH-type transcriptional repressor ComR [Nocardia macrotermitis]
MGRPRSFEDDTVIERAMEAFWINGYANTSPAQLAEATGLAKGSLYNAFGSKRELFERALARYDRLGADLTADFMSRPGSTREVVGTYLRHLVDADLEDPDRRGCLAANTALELSGHDEQIRRTINTITEHVVNTLAERIDQGRRDGDIARETDPRATAEFLMNNIVGLRVMSKGYDRAALHRIIDTTLNVL